VTAVNIELGEVVEADCDFILVPCDGCLNFFVGSNEVSKASLNELTSATTFTVEGSFVSLLEGLSGLVNGGGNDGLDAGHGVLPFNGDVLSGFLLDFGSACLTGFANLGELSSFCGVPVDVVVLNLVLKVSDLLVVVKEVEEVGEGEFAHVE